jgi:hypothetical protein
MNSTQRKKRRLAEALIAYAALCSLSVVSRFVTPFFFLAIVCGFGPVAGLGPVDAGLGGESLESESSELRNLALPTRGIWALCRP